MKTILLFILFSLSISSYAQSWRYNLDVKYENKPYTFSFLLDKKQGYDLLKNIKAEDSFPIVDFLVSNQQNLKYRTRWDDLVLDYWLTQSITWVKPEYRKFSIDLIRFGLEISNSDIHSNTFSRGLRTLEFQIKF